jgi:hypothetical protein
MHGTLTARPETVRAIRGDVTLTLEVAERVLQGIRRGELMPLDAAQEAASYHLRGVFPEDVEMLVLESVEVRAAA